MPPARGLRGQLLIPGCATRHRTNTGADVVSLNSVTFSTKVSGARSFAGKFVLVQRLSSTGAAPIKKVTLDANSSATFTARLHHGRSSLRVVMPTSQTEPGYITGISNVLTVTR